MEQTADRVKGIYVGAPACFALETACQDLNRAFDGTCYLVGSALERPDWRDIDVRLIMDDAAFTAEFPGAGRVSDVRWEFDPKWVWLTVAISERLAKVTGLPVDFQFQPRSHANARHKKRRNALGMYFRERDPVEAAQLAVGATVYERIEEVMENGGAEGDEAREIGVLVALVERVEGEMLSATRRAAPEDLGQPSPLSVGEASSPTAEKGEG